MPRELSWKTGEDTRIEPASQLSWKIEKQKSATKACVVAKTEKRRLNNNCQVMTTMNISLPENLKGFVDSQVQIGGYSTSSEYIRELIREDQKKKLEQRLSLLLLEGVQSGEPVAADAAYWNAKRQRLSGVHETRPLDAKSR